ncbi:putative aldouronate transport system permease protein [Paenibacillus sp. UNCCL117]|uniref:carbohydrate ABC transporter permease n=1 Tax=unclassified Paenibacillus TaxID=185978 RepID=UPI00088C957C|nr:MULTISPECIES: carbohydrate ABC transporter permease [unclassified Paenibacillus]SDD41942.1 putative aldouronate transport system permease protein [Paenibacillus sp. cl123]SFW47726.1 putative aldouronate transport system permease protein [Paenibacillus sp. UNCCL117]
MHSKTLVDRIVDNINIIVLAFVALLMLFPFYYMLAVSFTSYTEFVQTELLLWPKQWVADAYRFIFSSDAFIRSVGVTVFVTVTGTLFNLLLTSTMAYALSREITGKRVYLMMVLFTFIFSAGIIPMYLVVKATGLLNSYWALIIPGAISPFNLIVIRQFFMNIPGELQEAALIDGANDLQIFSRIVLPLSKPALAAFGLFYAVGHWNSYFGAILYISDPAKWTVQVILRQIVIVEEAMNTLSAGRDMMMGANPPPPETIGMAAILLATLPILIVYPFLQKHFAKGVMLGSVKG